ncbi:MAG: hydroxymethylbilane synthase [Halobacteriovoraceae bacterium]|nr:hydroxymethylbilane synthase [Halobacteriovoraceae bacterium]|tara:strand:+ start:11503 stop:13017 length:1515 start_codon:yes stop_codon:yes gene_type:complete
MVLDVNKPQFKLGTRGSLLATTQSTLTKNLIEQKSGSLIELQKIVTQGDKITDVPLWQIDGKDFFTKELDEALLNHSIDFVVHSYKDLGSERPQNIELGAITKRTYPHDILLIKKETIEKLDTLEQFIVGTSSPRRQFNIEKNLKEYIPKLQKETLVECENLRGNVNTRIQKLRDGNYHAIVLALAGLERLAGLPESKQELEKLLDGLNFIILPQKVFTSSASQGALALEIHSQANPDLKQAVRSVHCEQTAEEIARERKAFNSYGGGCHLAVGVYVKKIHDFYAHFHRGLVDKKQIEVTHLEGFDYSHLKGKSVYHVKGEQDFLISRELIQHQSRKANLFVTSSYCFHNIHKEAHSLWAAGNSTMKKLVSREYWVNGSAEGLGAEVIKELGQSSALQIMTQSQTWETLSHQEAESEWGEVIPCYTHVINDSHQSTFEDQLLNSDIILWSSRIQFEHYLAKYPQLKSREHASGLGKTFMALKEKVPKLIPCLDYQHLLEKTQEK